MPGVPRECPTFLRSTLSALLVGLIPGCTTTVNSDADHNVTEGRDARVGVGLQVADAASLWRADASGPVLSVSAGPARVERMRRGDAFLVLGRAGTVAERVPMDALRDSPFNAVFATRPKNASDELGRAVVGVRMFVAEAACAVPETLVGVLGRADGKARADAIDLAQYLVRVDPTRLEGSVGAAGRVNGWLRLTHIGRRKLVDALRAAGEPERSVAPATTQTSEGMK